MTGAARGYFDHNATTPMGAAARSAWLGAAERHWHNPSGLYREAGEARRVLEDWREALADRFGIDDPERIVFTSGATEANNSVIRHFSESIQGALAVSGIEHPSVAAAVETSFASGSVWRIPVESETGRIDLEALAEAIHRGGIGGVSVMAANNETGALQPWREIADLCRERGIPYHSDAAQWIGKMPLEGLGDCGYLTGSAHKFGGGKGVGFLVLPEGEGGASFHGLVGGPQEQGRRAGTENLPGVAAMATALLACDEASLARLAECRAGWRDAFEVRLAAEVGVRILAGEGRRLWNTSMFVLPYGKNLKWLVRLSQRGFAVSTGSACSAGKGNPSATMLAMGLDYGEMGRVLRVSGGGETTAEDWEALAEALVEISGELSGDRIVSP